MSMFEVCICVIASVYTFIYGLDVCFNIYLPREEDEEEEEHFRLLSSLSETLKQLTSWILSRLDDLNLVPLES